MTSNAPAADQIHMLLPLWKEAFGEWNGFWELFLETAFSPGRCRCITQQGKIVASLCWLDVQCGGEKMAYIYAVVTDPACRGQGLCRRLMEDTHGYLAENGYTAVLLVPAQESLWDLYQKLGYRDCTRISEFSCNAGPDPVGLRAIGPEEYARLRRQFLPEGGVIQEGESLRFLQQQAEFFTGTDVLLAAYQEEDTLHAMELLGDSGAAPGILAARNCRRGNFRIPGAQKRFSMFLPLPGNAVTPQYFGFAFD